jgi:hypothetical protein
MKKTKKEKKQQVVRKSPGKKRGGFKSAGPDRKQKLLNKELEKRSFQHPPVETVEGTTMPFPGPAVGTDVQEAGTKMGVLDSIKASVKFSDLKERVGNKIVEVGKALEVAPGVADAVTFAIDIRDLTKEGEELRTSVTKPLFDAKKQVDNLFHDVMDDLEARNKQVYDVLRKMGSEYKETVKLPGVGTLVVIPKPTYEVLAIEAVPDEYKMTVINDAAVKKALYAGVSEIDGIAIDTEYVVQARKEGEEK